MSVDTERIRRKLGFMGEQLCQLRRLASMDPGEFRGDPVYEAAAIRMLQITIEAMLDICAHACSREGWGLPQSYGETVYLAARHGLIPKDLADTYAAMARFRNRVVHVYDDIDSEELWTVVKEHLDDFNPFVRTVRDRYL